MRDANVMQMSSLLRSFGFAAGVGVGIGGVAAGCATHAPDLAPEHPARPSAPIGRLAGAPAALRPGVIVYDGVPALRPSAPADHHEHHHHP